MKIAITGANGQVGWELRRALAPLGEIHALDRQRCDLSHPQHAHDVIQALKPDLVVNAAAYTAVDRAETEEALATTINAESVGAIASALRPHGGRMIHYSTDYVFDGSGQSPYLESDATAPVSAYGRSKLAGERALAQSEIVSLTLRTCWVYAARGRNFLLTMLRLANVKPELRVVNDQLGSPTSARMIAQTTALLIARGAPRLNEPAILNLSCQGQASWCEFAHAIIQGGAERGLCSSIPVLGIPTAEYPTPAVRPSYSVLNPSALHERYNLALPHWQHALELVLGELADR